MELSAVNSNVSRSASQGTEELSTRMLRKVLDMQSDQGARLAQMVAQSSGLGQSIDTTA